MGSTTLRMSDLRAIGEKLGFGNVRTFIASGNLLFTSGKGEAAVKSLLEAEVKRHMARDVGVMVRTSKELADVVQCNPFAAEPGNKVVAIFFDDPPPADALQAATNVLDERLALGRREIYVHYPSGQGRSKLNLQMRALGTARNMNTVRKLAELAKEME